MLSKVHMVTVALAVIAIILGIVSIVTKFWTKIGVVHKGLWQTCVSGTGSSCESFNATASKKDKQYNNVTRVLTISLATLLLIGGILLAVSRESDNLVAGALGLILVGAASGVAAIILYPVHFKTSNVTMGYSYWLQVVATVFAVATTILLGITSHLKGGSSSGTTTTSS